jgi:hypothetical protein
MFEKDKEKIIFLMTEIDKIDGDIDNVVFDLYGLNDEERRIVLGW